MTYPDLGIDVTRYPRILVLGNSEAALCLYQRLQQEADPDQSLVLSRQPVKQPFDLVLDVDQPASVPLKEYDYALYHSVSWQFCMGLTPARKALRDSDWQAQRDLERLFLQWHDDGKHTLPMAILNLFRHREIMRAETHVEPSRVI